MNGIQIIFTFGLLSYLWYILLAFSPQFCGIQLVVTVLSHRCKSCMDSGEAKVESHTSSKHDPTKPHCFLTQWPLNPEASHTNVLEETLYTWQPCQPGPPQESLECNGTRTSLQTKPSTNPDDAGPIVCRPMGLPVAASCDRAWTWTRISNVIDHCATREALATYDI